MASGFTADKQSILSTNYHTHSRFCDGQGEIEDYVRAAYAYGFTSIGASSHAPVPFANTYAIVPEALDAYCAEVQRLRTTYPEQIEVLMGSEVDVIPGLQEHFNQTLVPRGFDYFIGSVHFVGNEPDGKPWEFDEGPEAFAKGFNGWYEGNVRKIIEDFYAIERQVPGFIPGVAIVGHMDRIKRFNYDNHYFSEDEPWYHDAVEETLETFAKADIIVELNTAGWRTRTGAPFPSDWVTQRCFERGIRMQINTDAHRAEHLIADQARGVAHLRQAGYREVWALRRGTWIAEALPEID